MTPGLDPGFDIKAAKAATLAVGNDKKLHCAAAPLRPVGENARGFRRFRIAIRRFNSGTSSREDRC
jgi:hypothetical protein